MKQRWDLLYGDLMAKADGVTQAARCWSGALGWSGPLGKSLSLPGSQFPFYQMIFNILPFSQSWCGDQGEGGYRDVTLSASVAIGVLC